MKVHIVVYVNGFRNKVFAIMTAHLAIGIRYLVFGLDPGALLLNLMQLNDMNFSFSKSTKITTNIDTALLSKLNNMNCSCPSSHRNTQSQF